jgi:hypothetical protein
MGECLLTRLLMACQHGRSTFLPGGVLPVRYGRRRADGSLVLYSAAIEVFLDGVGGSFAV